VETRKGTYAVRPGRAWRWLAVPVLALAVGGCREAPTGPPDQDPPPTVVEPIQVDTVDVRVAESFPVQVYAHVTGFIGDGCAELLPTSQSREGTTVTLEIRRRRAVGVFCTQIAKLYDESTRLTGEFPAGRYELRVNGKSYPFEVR